MTLSSHISTGSGAGWQRDACDEARYWDSRWLDQNARIRLHPKAAHLIVSRYPASQWRHARRTAVCAAGFNTPYWQQAVAAAYPDHAQGSLFGAAA